MLYQKMLSLLIALLILSCSQSSAAANISLKATDDTRQLLLAARIEKTINNLQLEEKVGQLFIVTVDGDSNELTALLHSFHPGGFIFFARHTTNLQATMQRIEQVKTGSRLLPFIAVDQEGGRVARLDFTTPIPSAASLSSLSPSTLLRIGGLLGQELQSLGFNLNFAPVIDVATRPDNPVIGDRSFSSDPATVALLGSAFIKGMQQSGVAAAAKHFPGHGDTHQDSHLELPIVTHSVERLESVEILPFRAAIRAQVAMIMLAHVHYPALDPRPSLPASLSKPIITDLLRKELQYGGIVITDAMNMKAITNNLAAGHAAVTALKAGVDIILMPENFPEAYHAVLKAVQQGVIPLSQIDDSLHRILRVKLELPTDYLQHSFDARLEHAQNTVGSSKHRTLMDQLLNNISVDNSPSL